MDKLSTITELGTKRAELRTGLDALMTEAQAAERELTAEESTRFDTEETEIRSIDERIATLDAQIKADEQHAATMRSYAPRVTVTSEPEVYTRSPQSPSYFRDMFKVSNGRPGAREASERLQRNDRIVQEKRTALSTVNGAGGEFVPPQWLEEDFVRYARPGRIFANLVPNLPLPEGTDSLNIPKVSTGTATALMTTQNSAVQETDLTTTSIASSVFTIAGGQTISLQLLEQSPLNIDSVVLQDLAAAYAVSLNSLLLSGTGSSGQPTGVLTLSGTNAQDCPAPSGSQTLAGNIYGAVAGGIAAVHTNRYMPADTIVMHPRRWASLLAATDTAGRPLVVPAAGTQGTGFNLLAEAGDQAAQGFAGTMQGLPVYLDALIPTNLTADTVTNTDPIIVGRLADLMLWESDIRAEAFQQTYAQNMSVYVRLYNYGSFQAGRYPTSISVITGGALAAPSFV